VKKVIGSKHRTANGEWLDALANIESLVTPEEVGAFAETATERIRSAARGRHAAYAWSGGKDSIVLADLCEKAGVHEGYFAYCDLDYPAFIRWCEANKPEGVKMMHTGYGLDLLVEHPELIFARGTHLLEPMKAIVKRLMDEGKSIPEIGKQLGMRPEEIFRLSGFTRDEFLDLMTEGVTGYSRAVIYRHV